MPIDLAVRKDAGISRTDAIQRAIVAELQRRRATIDDSRYLSSVTISVRLQDGPVPVRAITYEDQQIVARTSDLR